MANTRFTTLLSFLSFVLFAWASPASSTAPVDTSACGTAGEDIVKFTIDLQWGEVNPTNGVARMAIITNGTMPGPALNMKVGQTVEFTVINNLPNVTAIHFHGISQKATPWADGVPGVTEEPIPSGETYMYKWTADEAGTYFYHAHYKGQMMDGLYGAIIIAAADGAAKPFSLISNDTNAIQQMEAAEATIEPVFISDWVQYTFAEFWQIQKDANIDNACMDSIILNGKGSVYCLSATDLAANQAPAVPQLLNGGALTAKGCLPANTPATQGNFTFNLAALPPAAYDVCTPSTGETYTYTVDAADGWAAMTFINSGGFSLLKMTIDNHKLYVFAVNGHYVVPQVVDQVAVNNGDRVSFFVKLDQQAGSYPIRVANSGLNQVVSGFGALAYKGGSATTSSTAVSVMNYGGANTTVISALVDAATNPYPAVAVPQTADLTYEFLIKKMGQPFGAYEWSLSGINEYNMSTDDQVPLLFQNPSSVVASDTILKTQVNQVVDVIVKVQGPLAAPHPIHKHGNKAYVLGWGRGDFNWSSVAEAAAVLPAGSFNLVNPPYRDTFTTVGAQGNNTWMALRYVADQPGAWIIHCHMQTHFSGGMAAVFLDGVNDFPTIPSDLDSCATNGSVSVSGSGTETSSPSSTTSVAQFTGAASSVNIFGSSVMVSMVVIAAAILSM